MTTLSTRLKRAKISTGLYRTENLPTRQYWADTIYEAERDGYSLYRALYWMGKLLKDEKEILWKRSVFTTPVNTIDRISE